MNITKEKYTLRWNKTQANFTIGSLLKAGEDKTIVIQKNILEAVLEVLNTRVKLSYCENVKVTIEVEEKPIYRATTPDPDSEEYRAINRIEAITVEHQPEKPEPERKILNRSDYRFQPYPDSIITRRKQTFTPRQE